MSETIINGLFTIGGTVTGGLISYLIAKSTNEVKTLKSQVNILSNQVISYWNLEKLYSEELSKMTSKASRTILLEFRDQIETIGFERPSMTEKEAKKILIKNN